ncbi:MAG: NAD(P)-dependent alcohol dehydrogenase [Betaproteobacteria bacterium]|nr:NAD(P)-dependent alcohol dehydrogenase [Betaproteobacteria bacterium]
MKLYELQHKPGLDSITLAERADPKPGPGQILIKAKAWSLNYRDLLVAKGSYGAPPPMGRIPLSDGVGEVVEIGAGVTRVKVGDRVAGCFMQGWLGGEVTLAISATALGGAIDGMLAQYVVLSEQGVVQVPAHMSDEEAATLPCAGVTAWNALVREARIRAGDTVLLLGTGGVSLLALQFAKMHGARCILTSSSEEKLQTATRLGADETINYRANPNWDKKVLELTAGRGADIVVEVGGAGTFDKSLASVRMGGSVCMIGVLTGTSAPVSTAVILRRSIRVFGIYVGSRDMFEEMNRAIALHKLRPHIGKRFAFSEARAAYDYLDSAAHTGKVVIHG